MYQKNESDSSNCLGLALPHLAVAVAGTAAFGAAAEFVLEEPFSLGAPFLLALLSFRLDGEGDSDSPLLPFSVRGARSFVCEPDAWPFEAAVEEAGAAAAVCPLTRSSPGDSE